MKLNGVLCDINKYLKTKIVELHTQNRRTEKLLKSTFNLLDFIFHKQNNRNNRKFYG